MRKRMVSIIAVIALGLTMLVARPAQAACLLNLCAIEGLLAGLSSVPSDNFLFWEGNFTGVEHTDDGSLTPVTGTFSGNMLFSPPGSNSGSGSGFITTPSGNYNFDIIGTKVAALDGVGLNAWLLTSSQATIVGTYSPQLNQLVAVVHATRT